jgi:hypothetical protein
LHLWNLFVIYIISIPVIFLSFQWFCFEQNTCYSIWISQVYCSFWLLDFSLLGTMRRWELTCKHHLSFW